MGLEQQASAMMKQAIEMANAAIEAPLTSGLMDKKEHAAMMKDFEVYKKLLADGRNVEAASFLKKMMVTHDKPQENGV